MDRSENSMFFLCLLTFSFASGGPVWADDYDPLVLTNPSEIRTIDLTVSDQSRKRELPIRVYLPAGQTPAPVILFSHGLGGSRKNNPYLGNHWAGRGFVVVFTQHPGSDELVWKDVRPLQRLSAMRNAAGVEQFLDRVHDIPAILDQLDRWNSQSDHPLKGHMDLLQVGMSGHSFGAVTAQAISGQSAPVGKGFTDSRIKAAVMMSPSLGRGRDANRAFGSVKIPWMLLTGTADDSPIGDIDAPARLAVFPALPPGDKFELVLDQAEHSAFGERALPGETKKRNPNHHRAILAVTTAFWDAYLRNDDAAKKWLTGEQVQRVIEKNDRWQTR